MDDHTLGRRGRLDRLQADLLTHWDKSNYTDVDQRAEAAEP